MLGKFSTTEQQTQPSDFVLCCSAPIGRELLYLKCLRPLAL